MKLKVECLWHEKLPATAAALAVSPCGAHLFCGLEPADEGGDALLDLNPDDGSVARALALPGSGAVRSLRWADADASSLLCLRADGTFAALNAAGEVQSAWRLVTARPTTPKSTTKPIKPAKPPAAPPTPAPEGPEFLRAQGYRGPKLGYLYREGNLGSGYYRNDVVRQHTGAQPMEAAAAAAAPAAPQARGLRCCAAPASLAWVATASDDPDDGTVTVWRLGPSSAAAPRAALRDHAAGVLCLSTSPDGALLFSGSYDQTVRVWDTATWTCVRVLKGHGGGVRAAAPSPDGALLYTAAADNTVRAWAVGAWVCLRLMHGRHEDTTWPACMALGVGSGGAGDARPLLLTGSTGPFGASTLKAFEPLAGACLATFAQLGYDARGGQTAVTLAPSGGRAYSAASDGTVAAWKLAWDDGSDAMPALRRGFFG